MLHVSTNSGVLKQKTNVLSKNIREGVPWLEDQEASITPNAMDFLYETMGFLCKHYHTLQTNVIKCM
jgi:hypothetical protein